MDVYILFNICSGLTEQSFNINARKLFSDNLKFKAIKGENILFSGSD